MEGCIPSTAWRNVSHWSTEELCQYEDAVMKHDRTKSLSFKITAVMCTTGGSFGLVGFIFALALMQKKGFEAVSFMYHKAIAWIELVHMIQYIKYGFEIFYPHTFATSYIWQFIALWFGWNFGDSSSMAADLVTLFVTMERLVALLFPYLFIKVNTPNVARLAIGLSLAFCPWYIVDACAQDIVLVLGKYRLVPNWLGLSEGYGIYKDVRHTFELAKALTIAVTTVGVLWGFLRKARLAKHLNKDDTAAWKQDKQLCYLQLGLSIPLILNMITFAAVGKMEERQLLIGISAVRKLTYAEAIEEVRFSNAISYIKAINAFMNISAHATNCYLYVLFSKRFQQATLYLFFRRGVEPPLTLPSYSKKSTRIHPAAC